MSASQSKRTFIRLLRLYPAFLLSLIGIVYLLGGFSDKPGAILSRGISYTILTIVLGVAPLSFIIGFLIIGNASDREFLRNSANQNNFEFHDAFELPNEQMHGFKLASITGREPSFMGLTGDSYNSDDSAKCGLHPDHVPPVKDCQCGFHAYKELNEAKFELSMYRDAFLFDVDLYGLGFVYKRGYRAETQVINHLIAPRRCMLCKTLPVKRFVTKYEFDSKYPGIWRWQLRCSLCSSVFKEKDRMSIDEMAKRLKIGIV